mmetsp:Transcript_25223/g.66165  ORF Transcript_25223/g.66165 Transcript_25223/m.66165 type:complete len:98 (-) Transcript_25223:1085-1378(-)
MIYYPVDHLYLRSSSIFLTKIKANGGRSFLLARRGVKPPLTSFLDVEIQLSRHLKLKHLENLLLSYSEPAQVILFKLLFTTRAPTATTRFGSKSIIS